MKKKFCKVAYILVLTFLFIPGLALAAEKIDSFSVRVQINKDASINVAETITYDFGDAQKHGIVRVIPTSFNTESGKKGEIKILGIKVTGADEITRLPTTISSFWSDDESRTEIKIGSADKLVTGRQTYVIFYKIKNAIDFLVDYDRLYWNITGNQWTVPIEKSEAVVFLPSADGFTKIDCHAGPEGATGGCLEKKILPPIRGVSVSSFSAANLVPGSGLTIVVDLPKGMVKRPNKIIAILNSGIAKFFLPIGVFIVMFCWWWRRGRDAKGRGTIIPQYDMPDNLTPLEVGTILDHQPTGRDMSAEIIHLAMNGYISIERLEEPSGVDYEFTRLKDDHGNLPMFDQCLLSAVFESGPKVRFSALKENFYRNLQLISRFLFKSLKDKGYYIISPGNFGGYGCTSSLALFILFLGSIWLVSEYGLGWVVSLFLSFMISVVFLLAMASLSKKGMLVKEHILGLKLYLSVAEKDRLAFHNAPEKNPETFDKFLPYAMALGVEKSWASQFGDMYAPPDPEAKRRSSRWWREKQAVGAFTPVSLAGELTEFTEKTANIIKTKSVSSSSRGGFGGGRGFSGGGRGGGGGGSW